jgi:hypothetical protein
LHDVSSIIWRAHYGNNRPVDTRTFGVDQLSKGIVVPRDGVSHYSCIHALAPERTEMVLQYD